MSIVSVDNIQPIGSGTTVTVNKSVTLESGNTNITGVCTATSFVGSGANLTGISGVSVANQSDNRVITNTGTTDALNAEANLIFTGTRLGLNKTSPAPLNGDGTGMIHVAGGNPELVLERTTSGTEAKASIRVTDGEDFKIAVKDGSGSTIDALAIDSGTGNVTVGSGNLVIGTAGKGIDFSATADTSATGASSSSELLDDYEEGSWTPSFLNVNAPTYSTQYGRYCKNGSLVQLTGQISVSSGLDTSDGSTVNIGGFPFAGNAAAESCLFTFGRYTNLIPESKLDQFTNARFGGNYVMLHEGNNSDISYAELNTSGTIQFSVSYIMNT